MRPLKGFTIIDLSRLLPGPLCTYMLAALGARVIKIEDPKLGDYSRNIPPLKKQMAYLFLTLNRGKESIAVDLKTEKGQKIVRELIKRADVLIESFRPGTMARLGLDYEMLSQINKKLVCCSISGYGQSGSYALRPGHDLNFLALSGVLDTNRAGDMIPIIPGVQIADYAAALFAVISTLAAIVEVQKTKRGRYIDIPMITSALAMLFSDSARFFGTNAPPSPSGEVLSGGTVCYRVYRTKDDKFFTLAALEPQFWHAFCQAVNKPELENFAFEPAEPGDKAYEEMIKLFSERTQAQWIETLKSVDTCAEPVINFLEAISRSPLSELAAVETCDHPDEGEFKAVKLPGLDESPELPAPKLGQHTRDILKELGYKEGLIDKLEAEGIVRTNHE